MVSRLIFEQDGAASGSLAAALGFFAIVAAAAVKLVELGVVIAGAGGGIATLLASVGF